MARSFHAQAAIEVALPPAAGGVSTLRGTGGRLSVGGTLGTGDHGAVQCCGRSGAGVELARHGARVRAELEKRGNYCKASGAIRVKAPRTPLVRAWYLKESFQLFWTYTQPWRAKQHLLKWMNSAMRSKLEPFKKFVGMLRSHLDGILAWTKTRLQWSR